MPPSVTVSDEAQRIHREALVIDSHNDSIVMHIRRGNESLSGRENPGRPGHQGPVYFLRDYRFDELEAWPEVQLNLPKMRAGGIDAAYSAVCVTMAWKNQLVYAMDAFGYLFNDIEKLDGEVVIARTAAEMEAAKAAGRQALVLAIEDSDALEGSLNALRVFYEFGVRVVGLAHNFRTMAADGNLEAASGGGLTEFGRNLVREMNRLGVLVDISHLSDASFWQVIETTQAPIVGTHNCCRALFNHPRNLDDAQLKAVAQGGGVVGITYVRQFMAEPMEKASMADLLNHIDHAVETAGIDHVGLGSDFDGGGELLNTAAEVPLITQGLLDRGYRAEDIKKILGGNHARLFRQVCG